MQFNMNPYREMKVRWSSCAMISFNGLSIVNCFHPAAEGKTYWISCAVNWSPVQEECASIIMREILLLLVSRIVKTRIKFMVKLLIEKIEMKFPFSGEKIDFLICPNFWGFFSVINLQPTSSCEKWTRIRRIDDGENISDYRFVPSSNKGRENENFFPSPY